MRREADLKEWKELYEVATRIQQLKPWEYLWDMDIVGILTGDEPEDTVFYSVLGKDGSCEGITIYEGYEAFNTFMMLTMHKRMNLSVEYAMFSQKCLSLYWGNREELSIKQRNTIKELGYKYRGKNKWLYFMSYEPGYYPFNLDRDEVLRMTEHLKDFELAFTYYMQQGVQINFENGNMFSFVFSEDKKLWNFGEKELPFTSYAFGALTLSDEELIANLKAAPKGNAILELDVAPLGASVADKKYDKPANPMVSVVMDASHGMVISCEMSEPDEDAIIMLANGLLDFIYHYGAPKEVRVSNVIVEAGLEEICDICKIKLKKVKKLPEIQDFMNSMSRFR